MRIDVALLPGQIYDLSGSVCVVVDVLRASSSIVTLLERGAARVLPGASIDEAQRLRERFPDHLLCGEEDGMPPHGFDHGNSPAEFAAMELEGRGAVLATSNGTRVLASLGPAPVVLVGCFLNRSAVAAAAVALADEQGLDIAVLSSAAHGGTTFVLEDALGAGAIVDAALRLPDPPEALDAARFALYAFRARAADLPSAVASAHHARELVEADLGADVGYCSRLDVSGVVPRLEREEGLLVLRPFVP